MTSLHALSIYCFEKLGILSFLFVNEAFRYRYMSTKKRQQILIAEAEKSNFKQNTVCNDSSVSLFYQVMLNDLIFQQLQELLNHTSSTNSMNIGMNNLLNVSIKFLCMKKANYYWKLNRWYSLMYRNSGMFRERMSLLTNSEKYLLLDCTEYYDISDINALSEVPDIDVNRCHFL
jgi:hypothetical protein|mmetsp:Transcript_14486/g.13966  ORF Transcript_14486/g.13966 Transcript_14486/m.13966 type:complete len:175 (+) Transcript_14486:151-675(+)